MSEQPMFDMVNSFLKEDGWTFTQLEDQPVLQTKAKTQAGEFTCFAQAEDEKSQFVFYSVAPVNVPQDRLAEFAELLTRANYGIMIGNFEMDWNDGEIRYKTSIDVEGDRISPALIKQVIYHNVRVMGKYFPGIEALMNGDTTPAKAIEKVEG